MGVDDLGGGILLKNKFDILAEPIKDKRRKKAGAQVISIEDEKSYDSEQIMLMESLTPGKDLTSVNPFVLGKIIENVMDDKPLEARRIRDGKMILKVKTKRQATKLSKITNVPCGNHTISVRVIEHPTLNVVKGVIRCDDIAFLKEEEILEGLNNQNVSEVMIMKRKNREGELINTKMAIITFKLSRIPRKVDFGLYPVKVELYIPKPMRCTTCMRLGHTQKWCRGERKCAKCSQSAHNNICTDIKCVSCGEQHHTLDKECPIYMDECEIQKIRTEKRITYAAAKQIKRDTCPFIPKNHTKTNNFANTVKGTEQQKDRIQDTEKPYQSSKKQITENLQQQTQTTEKTKNNTEIKKHIQPNENITENTNTNNTNTRHTESKVTKREQQPEFKQNNCDNSLSRLFVFLFILEIKLPDLFNTIY
uniref:CCHC-type domain-containing protein n=1 Tax=Anopheles atroparvus TaxID=41427 RepID=A0AAG5DRZ8_ANOAO